MHSGDRALGGLVVLLALSLVVGPVAGAVSTHERPAAGASAPRPAAGDVAAALQQDVDADRVFMRAHLQPNGNATWAIEYRILLSTDNETAAFESLRRDVRRNPGPYLEEFAAGVAGTVAEAENVTGREMHVRNLSVRASIQQFGRYGAVTYTFMWTNFSRVTGDTVRAGDALAGLYLDGVTSLRFEWRSSYEATLVRPSPSDRGEDYVVWRGERTFGSGEPLVVITPAGPVPGALTPVFLAAAAVLALLVAGGGFLVYRRRAGTADEDAGASGEATEPPGGSATGGTAGSEAGDAAGEGGAGTGGTAAGAGEPPAELLSNEERVLKLLEDRGGRIKQQAVVEELDWTAAKTSQVVNDMKEDGQIEVFRLGRENVLRLPDQGPLDEEDQ
ncbi:MAG: helix-turn-helix transcriptional regulator [Halobacteriaceae archaeon]